MTVAPYYTSSLVLKSSTRDGWVGRLLLFETSSLVQNAGVGIVMPYIQLNAVALSFATDVSML